MQIRQFSLIAVALAAFACDGALEVNSDNAPVVIAGDQASDDAIASVEPDPVDDSPTTNDPVEDEEPIDDPVDAVASSDPLEGLPSGDEQWAALCSRGYQDTVTQAFCAGGTPPVLQSLADVRALLGLELVPGEIESATNGNPGFAVVAHSTAIGMRHVNELNPRVVIFTAPRGARNDTNMQPDPVYDILAFSRGESIAELASKDPVTGEPRFFLLRFQLGCESQAGGCTNHDLFTASIESGWTGYSIYEDEALENTTMDCLQCHQPGGAGTEKILRMHELTPYWNHWFSWESPEDQQQRIDFGAAHAGEPGYGGLPLGSFTTRRMTNPGHLEALVKHNGFASQPNLFDSIEIDRETQAMGRSPIWDALYAESVAGRQIGVPHWSTNPSDPTLVAQMVTAYQETLAGTRARDQLPDISQTIPASAWPDMSIRPKAGLDGRGILTHMCAHCHNSSLNPDISRASFDVGLLDSMSRVEKDEAIDRLMLPDDDRRKMPPPRFHELSDGERDVVIEELSK